VRKSRNSYANVDRRPRFSTGVVAQQSASTRKFTTYTALFTK